MQQKTTPQAPKDIIKNIYAFEFLDLKIKEIIEESDLETALRPFAGVHHRTWQWILFGRPSANPHWGELLFYLIQLPSKDQLEKYIEDELKKYLRVQYTFLLEQRIKNIELSF